MKKASEYRAHAVECRVMARSTRNPEHKAMVAQMAETWEDSGDVTRESIARQKRVAAPEGLEAPPPEEPGSPAAQ